MILRILLPLCLLFTNCAKKINPSNNALLKNDAIIIGFGSCSDQDREQILWDDILAESPDLWIWLGDNIYGDTTDVGVMREKYAKQKSHPSYQLLRQRCNIMGVWDDHDYGENDAGKEFDFKQESQQLLLDFLDVPEDDPRRKREGTYAAEDFSKNGIDIKVLLLDTRYFRDNMEKRDDAWLPNTTGQILGDAQWQWLERELQASTADVHIVASSIQVFAREHRFEKWSNFPNELERLMQLFEENEVSNTVFISGDRHIGEISRVIRKGKCWFDITSSSLTHGWSKKRKEDNAHRIGKIVYKQNYGILELIPKKDIEMNAYLKSDGRKIRAEVSVLPCNVHNGN